MDTTTFRVLIADDDPGIRRILARWLEKAGYQVACAADGQEALAALQDQCADFLLTDWEMPRLDGLGLCRAVRERTSPHYVYIIFLTVHSAPEEIVEAFEAGADEVLAKPVRQGELLARMRAGTRVIQLERRLSLMARTDPLTGLATQRTFYEAMEAEWERATRYRSPMSCVMADLDFFKRVNDLHGHQAGDALLKTVADLLTRSCRVCDLVCRYGGEEFCALLPETTEAGAASWAERVRQQLASIVVQAGDKQVRITGSFGVAQRHEDTPGAEDLVDMADQALLCAKQAGRDRVVRHSSLSNAEELDVLAVDRYGGLFQGVTARHVMSPSVACLRADASLGVAAEFFLELRLNAAPVIDRAGSLVGILSEKDLLAAMVALESWNLPVCELMRPNVICYEVDTPVLTIYEFLCRVSIRRVVITEQGRPVGTISRGTLLRWFRNLVIARGLVETPAHDPAAHAPAVGARDLLIETAARLSHLAAKMEARSRQPETDLLPYVGGEATRIQTLVHDLLALSRSAAEGPDEGSAREMLDFGCGRCE